MQTNIHDDTKKLHRFATRCYVEVSDLFTSLFMVHTFINGSKTNLEGVMTIPIPSNSDVIAVTAKLNDGPVKKSEILPKIEAANRYEKKIDEGNSPVSVKYVASGHITLNLGTLEPNDKVEVEIELAQKLTIFEDHIKLIIPTAIAPKYGYPLAAGYEPQDIPTVNLLSKQAFKINIHLKDKFANSTVKADFQNLILVKNVENNEYKNGSNPFDKSSIIVSFENKKHILHTDKKLYSNRDFALNIELPDSYKEVVLQTKNPVSKGVIAVANIYDQINNYVSDTPQVHVLVDCSGSMKGLSENLAKSCVENLGHNLPNNAKTALSFFGTYHKSIYILSKTNNSERLVIDSNLINSDMGSTNLEKSLLRVLKKEKDSKADILLISDGAVYGDTEFMENLNKDYSRVFTVAIGSSPSHQFLNDISNKTGGINVTCNNFDDISETMKLIINNICRSQISVTEVSWPGKPEWTSMLPKVIFDNISASIYAFYPASISENEKLKIKLKTNSETIMKELFFGQVSKKNNALIAHAAIDKIFSITGRKEEKTKIALDYQILTSNTSMFIPNIRNEDKKVYPDNTQIIDGMMTDSHGFSVQNNRIPNYRISRNSQHLTDLAYTLNNLDSSSNHEGVVNYSIIMTSSVEKPTMKRTNNFYRPYPLKYSMQNEKSNMEFTHGNNGNDVSYKDTIYWIAQLFDINDNIIANAAFYINERISSNRFDKSAIRNFAYNISNSRCSYDDNKNYFIGLWEVLGTLISHSKTTDYEYTLSSLPYKKDKKVSSPLNYLFTYIEYFYGNSPECHSEYHSSAIKRFVKSSSGRKNAIRINNSIANEIIRKFNLNKDFIYKASEDIDNIDILLQDTSLSKWRIGKKQINNFVYANRKEKKCA